MKKKKSSGGIFKMLIMISIVPLILSIAIISITSIYSTKTKLESQVEETLHIVANNLSNYCSGNNINAGNASSYYEYLDGLKDQGIEMAIVFENKTCASSLKNENDYRIREMDFNKDFKEDKEELLKGYFDESVVISGNTYYGYFMPVITNGEIVAMSFAGELKNGVTQTISKSIMSSVLLAVILTVIFTIIVLVFSRKLVKSVKTVGENVSILAKGDLSRQPEQNGFVREMDELLEETGQMQEKLSGIIGKVKNVSCKLSENIGQVTSLSNSSAGRAKQITNAMEELSLTASGMAENVQNINVQMMEIGNSINDISQNVEYLHQSSENILQTNNDAKANMDVIMENSVKSVDAVKGILAQIKETNYSIAEIDKAVGLIIEISEQTKLLSLNASIEAARAGELGKGFAVVAGEIGSLSEQSTQGADMIKNLAQTIMEKSQISVKLADGISSMILEEQESISATKKKYEELSEDINQSVIKIRDIAEKTDSLTKYKEKVIDNVSDLSAISEENYASNEEVTANVSEIIAEVETVNENCNIINEMSAELEEAASYFHE